MSEQPATASDGAATDLFAGGGEMGARMRTTDWSKTAVGPPAAWPQSLRTVVRILLNSRYAMWLGWGPDFTFFYNDAYRPTLGVKHEWALGAPAREVWAEIWPDIGPRAGAVLRTGVATWDESLLLFLERSGYSEETYHTFSYSPVPDDRGAVGGMLCVVTEDTDRKIGERRLALLRELASDLAATHTEEEVFAVLRRRIDDHPQDLPFTLTYLFEEGGKGARLACATGVAPGSEAAPEWIETDSGAAPWPAQELLARHAARAVDDLAGRFASLPTGPWDRPPRQAAVVPVAQQGQDRPAGFLVAAVNPYRPFDAAYQGFVELLAGQIASGLGNARAYEQERSRAEALAELDRAKTAFFNNVSHEFRTPLTLLLGPLEDALSETARPLPPEQRERLETAHRNSLRLLKLVNTLLDFARLEAGRMEAVCEPTDLAEFTAELAGGFRSACERAGLRLVVDCPALGEPVYVDRDMWEKIVLNLTSNAFKFTEEGEIRVGLRRAGGAAELRVTDTGTGIPEAELPHLFERFHRVRGARGRTQEGTGIGLALVQHLVKLHGGSVRVESAPGQGSTFTVTVPLGHAHLPPERVRSAGSEGAVPAGAGRYVNEALRWLPDAADQKPGGQGDKQTSFGQVSRPPGVTPPGTSSDRPRILLADDNADMREYVTRLLGRDYEVQAVREGEAALAAARERPPDLVLSDVMMPRLDGFALLRALRAEERTRSVPVVLLSARAGEEARLEGLERGADDYLIKPFSARELRARVGSVLELARVRREAAEALRAREEHLRTALQAARMATWEWDLSAGTVSVSGDAAAQFFGKASVSHSIEHDWSLVHPEDRQALQAVVGEAIAQGGGYSHQYRFSTPAGYRWLEVHGTLLRDDCGRAVKVSGVLADVTERKRTEGALLRYAGQLQRLAAVAARMNAAHDPETVLRVVTEEAQALVGAHQALTSLTAEHAQPRPLTVVSLTDKYERWRNLEIRDDGGLSALVCRTNRPVRLTQEGLEAHPDYRAPAPGSEGRLPLRGWLAAPLVARDGHNLGLVRLSDRFEGEFSADDEAILVQLAQMGSVALANARLYQELREADRRKDEFLATLAHELRNPLAPIRNALHLLRLGSGGAPVERVHEIMERQVNHMVRLVDDLLEISRITRGKIELRREKVDIAVVVRSAVDTSRPLIDTARHRLEVSLPPGPLTVDADPVRLSQVLANLLNNSAKYTPEGGHIWLSVRQEGGEVVVSVRDTGVGIPAEMLPRVFDLFTQVDRTRKHAQGGLGIGLALVKRLVEMHHGRVEAFSPGPGQGSELVVRLPLVRPAAAPAAGALSGSVPPPAQLSPTRILIVDDNRDAADSLGMMLRFFGSEVRTAHDGPSALEAIAAHRPRVVLLDIGMPGMDGYEVARRVRERPEFQDVVLIALTGWGQQDDRRRSKEAGFDHHLVKPVESAVLRELLASFDGSAVDRQAAEAGP